MCCAWPARSLTWIGSPKGGAEPTYIAATYVTAAARLWRNYFWPHSRTALRQVGLSDRHRDARRVLRWIRGNDKAEISVKDIRREALGQKLDAEQTTNLLQGLVKAGWLQEVRPAGPLGRGKPALRWKVNPTISQCLNAENAESDRKRSRRHFLHFVHFVQYGN